jgi:hypothetical protein
MLCLEMRVGEVTYSMFRFLSKTMAEKYGLDSPPYQGVDQIVEIPVQDQKL